MRLEHVALWVGDLERVRAFYLERLGGSSGPLYENLRTGFRSYFVSFEGGARLELMTRPAASGGDAASPRATGSEPSATHAHVAFVVGSWAEVDAAVARLEAAGVVIAGRPRVTGDGYYEAVIEDPEGNLVELVAERPA